MPHSTRLIRLEAFDGKMKSEVIEWPDWPPYIYWRIGESPAIGVFHIRGTALHTDGRPVATYTLIGIKDHNEAISSL